MANRADAALDVFVKRPPPPPGWYEVLRPEPDETLRLTALSGDIEGANLHYHAGRSVVCIGKENGCTYCKHKPHWEGYLFGYDETRRKIVLSALTAGAVRNCWQYHSGLLCRGRRFEVHRPLAGGKNGKVVWSMGDIVPHVNRLPACPNLRECLSRMWGIPYVDPNELAEEPAEGEVSELTTALAEELRES